MCVLVSVSYRLVSEETKKIQKAFTTALKKAALSAFRRRTPDNRVLPYQSVLAPRAKTREANKHIAEVDAP